LDDSAQIPDYVPPSEPVKWFHNGWCSRSLLIIAGLFFFLPFINIKCSGSKLATIKGTDLLTGTEMTPQKIKKEGADTTSFDLERKSENTLFELPETLFEKGDRKKIAPNVLALISLAVAMLSLVFSFFGKRIIVIISGGLSLLGALSLFFIQIQVSNAVETKIGPLNFSPIAFEFTPYYWSCLFFMAIAAVFSFVRSSILVKK